MTEETKSGISRRTLAKGAAWSVPAVAVAAAAPAYAVSGPQPTIRGGQAFKLSGNSCSNKTGQATGGRKAYLFTFRVTNNDNKPIYLYGATISISGTSIPFQVRDADPDWGTAINAGQTVDVTIWGNGGDSANTEFTATAEVFWGHVAAPGTLALPITSNAANPDKRPNNTPWHAPVTVGPWRICGTPTLPSQDLEKCENPGFIPVPATCPQPTARSGQTAREAVADEAVTPKAPEAKADSESTKAPEPTPEAKPEPTPSAAAEASTDADA